MWLAYRPPEMLPTGVLDPMGGASASASASVVGATATGVAKVGRGEKSRVVKRDVRQDPEWSARGWRGLVDADDLFWVGVVFMSVGGLLVTAF